LSFACCGVTVSIGARVLREDFTVAIYNPLIYYSGLFIFIPTLSYNLLPQLSLTVYKNSPPLEGCQNSLNFDGVVLRKPTLYNMLLHMMALTLIDINL
jgi:hypothetical protein